jgi:DNA-binding XRE family transcriptional regulator
MTTERSKPKYGSKELEKDFGPLTFARLVRSYRYSEELTQVELAKKLGLSKANLCDIEKGRKLPSIARASAMAKKLGENPQFWVEMVFQDMLRQEKMKYTVKLEAKDAA